MVKLHPRLLGVALIAASGASALGHRAVYEAARYGPAQAAEFGLGLLTFMLASVGVLLIIHGGKLFEHGRGRPVPSADENGRDLEARLMAPITPAGRVYDTRHGVSLMKARHAGKRSDASTGRRMVVELALQDSRRRGPIAPRH